MARADASYVNLSVCPTHLGVVPKRLNSSSKIETLSPPIVSLVLLELNRVLKLTECHLQQGTLHDEYKHRHFSARTLHALSDP